MKRITRYFFVLTALWSTCISVMAQRIAVLSDVHVTPGNACDSALQLAVKDINSYDYDLVVMNGDLTNEGSDRELKNVKNILDRVTHRFVALPGNHENNWSQSATRTFVDLWGNDRFVEDLGSAVVVGINCGPYMKMGDGHIKQEDLHWLRSVLTDYTKQGKRILSFNHYPLQDDIDNWSEYVSLLEEFPVIGHINGHYHTWKSYTGGDINAAMTRALDMRNGTFGYAIIDISEDSVRVYEKTLNQEPVKKISWAVKTHHTPTSFETVADTEMPAGFEIKKIWNDSASIFTRLTFDNENIYFGNSLGQFKAIGKNDHKLKFVVNTEYPLFSRATHLKSGLIAVPCSDGILVVDPSTGKTINSFPSLQGPYVADGTVTDDIYIQGGYCRIERRNSENAELIWSYDSLTNYCQAAPVIKGTDVIIGAWDTKLRCLDTENGHLKWQWDNGKSNNLFSPGNVVPVVTDSLVIIVAPDRYMTAIDRTTGKTVWRDNSHRYRESLGHSADGSKVYAKTMDGHLVAVDANTDCFRQIFDVDLGIGYDHAPCVIAEINGIIYAGSRRGIICAVDSTTHNLIWSRKVGNGEVNAIDVDPSSNTAYFSLIDGTIFRVRSYPETDQMSR